MISYVISHNINDIIYDIICDVQAQGAKTYAGRHNSGAYHHFTGKERLDVHLLKPSRLEVVQEQLQEDMCEADIADQARWIECKYRTSHPIIRWLPTKLAAWIGDNYGQELGIPPMRGQKWTAGELNAILLHNLVPSNGGAGQLRTFGCIEWESEHYSGRPKARCYPFDLPGHRWRGRTCQVSSGVISYYDIIHDIIL